MIRVIFEALCKLRRGIRRIVVEPIIRNSFGSHGAHVRVLSGCSFTGIGNIHVGNDVVLGENTRVLSTRAKLKIGNHVMFGPGVMVVTGDHRTDVIGKYMINISDTDKVPEDDQDVVIEDDVWIAANAIILKGVTVARGSVIAAGAVVTQSTEPYSIVAGVPAKVIKHRFSEEKLKKHEEMIGLG